MKYVKKHVSNQSAWDEHESVANDKIEFFISFLPRVF